MLRRLASFFTYVMRHYLPDAYLFAILLTFLSGVLALIFTKAGFMGLIRAWGDGVYGIVAFAMQMILILITGHALALTPQINRILVWIAGAGSTPIKGGMIVVLVAGICSWLNWGFGLIVGGLLALEVAKRAPKVDYPYLIGAAYGGLFVGTKDCPGPFPLLLPRQSTPRILSKRSRERLCPFPKASSVFSTFCRPWSLFSPFRSFLP